MSWFALFLYAAALGIATMLCQLPFRDLGAYFFRFHAAMILVLTVLATLFMKPLIAGIPDEPLRLLSEAAFVLFALTVLLLNVAARSKQTLRREAVWLPLSAGVPALVFAFYGAFPNASIAAKILMAAHGVTSAWVLGAATVAMILGHWYLVNAALSFDHLIRLTRLLVAGVLVKTGVSAALASVEWNRFGAEMRDMDGMFILVRVLAGLLSLGVLSFMALSCARRKANQSATGILYVAVVFVIIGEVTSLYLTLERGLPV